jgi:drug/metabolite transporter (DMT)-like permease
MGAAVTAGMLLFTAGSRWVPSAELALLSLTEVVLGPIWVWLAFAEVPSVETLLGGALVLAAMAGRALSGIRRRTPSFGAV